MCVICFDHGSYSLNFCLSQASHVDTDCDRSSLQPTCNIELFLNQPDIADSTDPIAMNYNYDNKDRITNKGYVVILFARDLF